MDVTLYACSTYSLSAQQVWVLPIKGLGAAAPHISTVIHHTGTAWLAFHVLALETTTIEAATSFYSAQAAGAVRSFISSSSTARQAALPVHQTSGAAEKVSGESHTS
jgi:hypothetical protein